MKKFIFTVLLVLMVCLVMGASAEAGCRSGVCGVTTYSTTYQYPVTEQIIVPISVPVLIPAFQYQYVPAVAVPVAVPATPLPAPVAAPTPVAPAVAANPDMKALAKALLAEMSSQQVEDTGPPVAIMDFGTPAPPNPPPGGFAALSKCAACHTGPSARNGVQIFTSPGVFNRAVDKQRIIKSIMSNKMPLDQRTFTPVPLSDQEKLAIQGFLSTVN